MEHVHTPSLAVLLVENLSPFLCYDSENRGSGGMVAYCQRTLPSFVKQFIYLSLVAFR